MEKSGVLISISLFFSFIVPITVFAADPYTARERARLIRESQRYLNAVDPEMLRSTTGMTRAEIMKEIKLWKSPDSPKEKPKAALIENVKKAAAKSVKDYQQKLEWSRASLSQANQAAQANQQRLVMTGLINQGAGLCKKMHDLLQPVPTMKVWMDGKEVEVPLC